MTPSTAYQRVVDRLTASGAVVRVIADGAMATCPAHPDRNPSLHVARGERGVVLTCHAGCAARDVCAALGLAETDLFDEPLPRITPGVPSSRLRSLPMAQPVAEYLYHDATGAPVLKVIRLNTLDGHGAVNGKTFRQMAYVGSSWVPRIGDLEPPLYRLPEVLAAVREGRPVFVCEGEKDADTLAALGHVATTSPMGAGKWRSQHTAALKGAASVMVVADDDPPGHAHARTVQHELEPVVGVVVTLLPAQGCKDLTDHLTAGYTLNQLRPTDLAAFATPIESTGRSVGTPRLLLTKASTFKPARVRWGWEHRMPVGELCLIPGREGVGKSLMLAWLTAMLTRGKLPGDFQPFGPRAVLYIASEDSWRYTITPRLLAADADLDLVYRVDAIEEDLTVGRLSLPADCADLADAALSVKDAGPPVAAIMLDPVISLIDEALSVNQSQQLRRALEPLRRVAEETAVIMPALAHFNKTTDTDILSKIPGSRAWVEVARAALAMGEDLDADDTEGRVYIAQQVKNNLGRLDLPTLTYRIEETSVPTDDGPASVGRLVWTGESMSDLNEQLSHHAARRGRHLSENTAALISYINQCGYPVPLADFYAEFPDRKQNSVRQALARLAEAGTVSNPVRGHYGPV